jgi:hypothetical protein
MVKIIDGRLPPLDAHGPHKKSPGAAAAGAMHVDFCD